MIMEKNIRQKVWMKSLGLIFSLVLIVTPVVSQAQEVITPTAPPRRVIIDETPGDSLVGVTPEKKADFTVVYGLGAVLLVLVAIIGVKFYWSQSTKK